MKRFDRQDDKETLVEIKLFFFTIIKKKKKTTNKNTQRNGKKFNVILKAKLKKTDPHKVSLDIGDNDVIQKKAHHPPSHTDSCTI